MSTWLLSSNFTLLNKSGDSVSVARTGRNSGESLLLKLEGNVLGCMWIHMPIISALGKSRQGDHESETSPSHLQFRELWWDSFARSVFGPSLLMLRKVAFTSPIFLLWLDLEMLDVDSGILSQSSSTQLGATLSRRGQWEVLPEASSHLVRWEWLHRQRREELTSQSCSVLSHVTLSKHACPLKPLALVFLLWKAMGLRSFGTKRCSKASDESAPSSDLAFYAVGVRLSFDMPSSLRQGKLKGLGIKASPASSQFSFWDRRGLSSELSHLPENWIHRTVNFDPTLRFHWWGKTKSYQQGRLKAGLTPDRLCPSRLLSFGPFDFQRKLETINLWAHSPPSYNHLFPLCQATIRKLCKTLSLPGSGCVQVVSWTHWLFYLSLLLCLL